MILSPVCVCFAYVNPRFTLVSTIYLIRCMLLLFLAIYAHMHPREGLPGRAPGAEALIFCCR
jgi:hypothetical protein